MAPGPHPRRELTQMRRRRLHMAAGAAWPQALPSRPGRPGFLPARRAGRRIPFRAVRFLFEMKPDQTRLAEVDRILDLRRDREPFVTVLALEDIPVLGKRRVCTVRDAVLPQVTGTNM